MHATLSPSTTADRSTRVLKWRVVDIVVASVVAVASGVVFWVWGQLDNPISGPVSAVLPGFQGILNGPWLFAGVLGALIIRKPGAAIYTELVAATVSALIGTQWGFATLISGLVQGLGVEIVFALFLYANWRLPVALLAGAGAGIAESILDLLYWYPGSKLGFVVTYTITTTISGIVVAGLLSWLLVRALAKTGALSRFASGREATGRV
ncbi:MULTISPECIES: ECF transporter S component [unclassified Leifsonia]|uniref:ECF transporter S component n=1 Tax=unclassified Leifsonia TaxID=2663824 RepID=UPI000A19AD2C|nr:MULTISPECIES: ECF transporter S component [unclassified Leifsonia]QIZ98594.1 ECF transporter S component [Leifsonia sp. PS1209]